MPVTCPNCGAAGQEAGKYCENCGFLIPEDAVDNAGAPSGAAPPPSTPDPSIGAGATMVGAQFAVVRNGHAKLDDGFTLARVGEFLVGRMDQESGNQVDVDLRQWVQPIDIQGQKQYLVHRKQCYLGLSADGRVTVRPCSGAEGDTLVRPLGQTTFTSLQNLGSVRPAGPDGSFEVQTGEQIFMGDPDAVMYYMSGDPTAQDNYLVIELINKS